MPSPDSRQPPFYIVGLPETEMEGAEAKTKFERLGRDLVKAFPSIMEIRAVVKTKRPAKSRGRYEVSVEVYTPKETHSFSETGYNIAVVFDRMGPRMKRLLSSKPSRVTNAQGETRRKATE